MARPLVEHLEFPGMSREAAMAVEGRLEAVSSAAQLFASGLLDRDVEVTWSLGHPQPVRWMRDRDGTLSVRLWVDLLSPVDLPPPGDRPEDYLASFQSGFLHMLGRVLGSGLPPLDPVDDVFRSLAAHRIRVREIVGDRLARADGEKLVAGLFDDLEGARTDGLLLQQFRGARRHLRRRVENLWGLTGSPSPVAATVAALALSLMHPRGIDLDAAVARGSGGDPVRLAALTRLVQRVGQAVESEGRHARLALAEFVVTDLLSVLLELQQDLVLQAPESEEDEGQDGPERALLPFIRRKAELCAEVDPERVGSQVVFLPHVEGGMTMVRIERAEARWLAPDKITRRVLRRMLESYGAPAVAAFAEESAALRRALRVNWERRYRGRYRSGKRVGIANLRRFMMQEDLRLFQRLQLPDAMSYYFHVLVDTSYSMLEDQNAEKAFAIAYAFTALLYQFRVPVDVTLYASGVTDLYDHRVDTLEPYFGREFGYLVSGTLEMEAIAYAKQKADQVQQRRKIFVVITDGTPAQVTLRHLGSPGLPEYYGGTFIPWLRESGIELMAIGIGVDPAYHERSCRLTESWEAIPFLMELLEEIVQEGERQEHDLWV